MTLYVERVRPSQRLIFDDDALIGLKNPKGTGTDLLVGNVYQMPQPNGADDTAAFTKAIAAGKYIQLQRGTYIVGSQITGLTNIALVGAGRDKTTIKIKDGANLTAAFQVPSGATNVTVLDITFDCNGSNQTTHSSAIDLSTNVANGVHIERCRFKNIRGLGSTGNGVGAFNLAATNVRIVNCLFENTTGLHMRLTGCSGVVIQGCHFTDYGQDGTNPSVRLYGDANTKSITFIGNTWKNTYAGVFCIESVPTGIVYHPYVNVVGNLMDGGGLRGTGVSGFFADSVIANNVLLNGGDEAGSFAGQRNGIEVYGTRCVISGNFIENGCIALGAGGSYSNGQGNTIVGNVIKLTEATATNCTGITFRAVDDTIVTGNEVTVKLSGSATMQSAIYVGTYGTQGVINRARVFGNVVRRTDSNGGNGIRVLSTSSTDVDVHDNTVSGFNNGIIVPATSVDTNLRIQNNNIWNNTTALNGTNTSAGFMDRRNIKATGGLSVQTVASSATPALNCAIGDRVLFTATAASTWGAASNIPPQGETVTVTITQDGTGGWAISWNAAYVFPTAWTNTGNTANKKSTVMFVSDGSKLIAQGANSWY